MTPATVSTDRATAPTLDPQAYASQPLGYHDVVTEPADSSSSAPCRTDKGDRPGRPFPTAGLTP